MFWKKASAAVVCSAIALTNIGQADAFVDILGPAYDEPPTWEELFHNLLNIKREFCEDKHFDERPWTCERIFLHEDAFPALQMAIRIAADTHKQNLLRIPMSEDAKDADEECEKRAKDVYRYVVTDLKLISNFAYDILKVREDRIDVIQALLDESEDGKIDPPPKHELLQWVDEMDIATIQLIDLRNSFQYPVVQERIEHALDQFFLVEITNDCPYIVDRVLGLDDGIQTEEKKSDDSEDASTTETAEKTEL